MSFHAWWTCGPSSLKFLPGVGFFWGFFFGGGYLIIYCTGGGGPGKLDTPLATPLPIIYREGDSYLYLDGVEVFAR